MNWLLSLLAAVVCGIVGLFTSGVVAAFYAEWFDMSTRDGRDAFFVIGMALLGGMVCTIGGLVLARLIRTEDARGFLKAAGISSGIVVSVGAACIGIFYLLADFPPTLDGNEMMLEVEIRLPEGRTLSEAKLDEGHFFYFFSAVDGVERTRRYGQLNVDGMREEGGRWIIPAEAFLYTDRGQRGIEARIGEEKLCGFLVPLPAHPGPDFEQWSKWLPEAANNEPSFRFRVKQILPPPPPLTDEEVAANNEREEQEAFEAIAPDAPLAALLPYTPSWINAARRTAAIERITARPDYVRELGAMMRSADMREAEAAMNFVGELPQPDPALVPEVQAAGRDVIERIKKFNVSTVEQDPSYEGAADVSVRFSPWMAAVRALQGKSGADFVPDLAEILDLSRVRTDSYVMQQDVRRVASYYMKEWAGIAPLPGDPPPR
jgi:hypothetical protein